MKGWRIIIVLLLCLVLAGSTACNLFGGDKEEASQQLVEVVRGDLTISVSGSGNIDVANEVELTFGTGGKVDKIYVKEGDRVSRGGILGRLDTSALELAVTQAQTALETAEYNLDKVENPCSSLEISALELAVTQAEVALTQAQAALETAEYNLDKVKNPYSSLEISALELAVTQAEVVLTQAQLTLEVAKFNLDRMEDVAEAKDDVSDAEYDVKVAQARLKEAYRGGDEYEINYWRNEVVLAQARLVEAQQELAEVLADPDYATLVVDEVIIKELQVEAAEQSVKQAQKSLEYAQKQLDEATIPDEDDVKQMEIQVETAKESIKQAQKSLEHAQKQLDEATIPDEDDVKLMEIQVETAKESLEHAQKQLEEAIITAPFDGVVASVDADEGDTVLATKTIVHLIDIAIMELKVEVDEIDIPSVREEQKAVIDVDALPELQLEGKVTSISLLPEVEAGVIVYEVKISLDVSQDLRVKVGMSATADIIIDKQSNVLLVPNRAIKQDNQGNPIVKVMVNEQIEQRSVVVGISDGYQTEIVSGLDEGDVVVIEKRVKKEPGGLF